MTIEENDEIEKHGYDLGNNPNHGGWKQKFNFPPVSYSNQSELRQEFKIKLQLSISTNYIYTQQVQLTITLYLNEEKMLNTPEYGDLDNYAKSICDAIKGKNGLIIDDCQIQRLDISWIDIPDNKSYFEIEIQSTPDEYCSRELSLYEMPNNKYYPIPNKYWNNSVFIEKNEEEIFLALVHFVYSTKLSKDIQHNARKKGKSQTESYYDTKLLHPIVLGYHKTRIIDSGFNIVKKNIWRSKLENWLSSATDSHIKQKIIKILDILKKIVIFQYISYNSNRLNLKDIKC
ncbi:MAG: RusA family crossover junction endodeoxyribonuclease [Sulfurospirillaceae bacterium]|nr:RusA family crossover junction endodeoxyribonuclease [Sulfurospirillaceae bacterium]MDD3463725.1 RusA family crossover junction endodeoxyribonuclease [Sulfurospirillaceae bacterium]